MFWKKKPKTKIIVQYDAGFPNTLYIRGEGISELSWDHGVPLQNVSAGEWVYETSESVQNGQFKVLLNDMVFELGDNHGIDKGLSLRINPQFP